MLTTSRVNDFSFATYVRVVIKPRPQSEITKFCVRTLKSSQILSKVIRFNLKFDHLTSPFAALVFVLTVIQPWRHETCFASLHIVRCTRIGTQREDTWLRRWLLCCTISVLSGVLPAVHLLTNRRDFLTSSGDFGKHKSANCDQCIDTA